MLFLKGPEGRRKATAGRKENGELPLGRAGAGRRAGSARRTFLSARAGIGGHRPGWVGGRFRPAAGGYPQSEPCLLPAAAAASPKSSSILLGPRLTRLAGSVTRVRPVGMGRAYRILLDGEPQLLRRKVGGARAQAQLRTPPNAGFSVRAQARPEGSVGTEPFRLAAFGGGFEF